VSIFDIQPHLNDCTVRIIANATEIAYYTTPDNITTNNDGSIVMQIGYVYYWNTTNKVEYFSTPITLRGWTSTTLSEWKTYEKADSSMGSFLPNPSTRTVKSVATNVATLGSSGIYVGVGVLTAYQNVIFVDLKPTKSALAGETYDVDLYEKGAFRATTKVRFTQPEINVQSDVTVYFPASQDEFNAYYTKDISHIFSVKVHGQ
jgi:hypothetical protein